MTKPTLSAACQLVDEVRALYATSFQKAELWEQIAGAMRKVLVDPAIRQAAQSWPLTVEGTPLVGNLLFYEDPDYGFVFNGTVRKPNTISNVHDHGAIWTLYGLIEGQETICRYERTDNPSDTEICPLVLVNRRVLGPGEIDIVPPGKIHQEHAGAGRSIAFIVRARRPGTFQQHRYDPVTGEVSVTKGPQQLVRQL